MPYGKLMCVAGERYRNLPRARRDFPDYHTTADGRQKRCAMPTPSEPSSHFETEAEQTATEQRTLQDRVAQADEKHPKEEATRAMQAGARKYPEPPLTAQHLEKPGLEADLKLAPMCDAPYYKGSEKLKDKVALITGGDSGI